MTIPALARRWRDEAAVLRRNGDERVAGILELHASEMLEAAQQEQDELVPQGEACRLSGYSARHLRNLDLTNYGRPGAPLYRRADLPRKPGYSPPDPKREAARLLAS